MDKIYQGQCHCGLVKFKVNLDLSRIGKCNCSLCKRRNANMAYVDETQFQLQTGAQALSKYQFNTQTAEHFFCNTCGIYTHHKPRTQKQTIAVNTACIDTLQLNKLVIKDIDGKSFEVI
ncbi:GFA family protein [Pseudoalteromonas denitrificans]|uniref:Uncharacterized conserved protein n=1 Tax=Pseudoalteromonas denitrificans DSM 6059 TaxID=1123010 RepID=A0A1I1SSN7_9GAMM|nr:GFA family protein [Pseudoalteromonas denitrificans]SFD49341.1 Uncharacterized conserved protein [Pseudoalteromonas denitrificans DSM 6059]